MNWKCHWKSCFPNLIFLHKKLEAPQQFSTYPLKTDHKSKKWPIFDRNKPSVLTWIKEIFCLGSFECKTALKFHNRHYACDHQITWLIKLFSVATKSNKYSDRQIPWLNKFFYFVTLIQFVFRNLWFFLTLQIILFPNLQ